MIEYQKAVQQRRWLALPNGDEYHLSPAWTGESFRVNPSTAGGSPIDGYAEFSFRRPGVDASTYEEAFAGFNRELRTALAADKDMARAIGLSAKEFDAMVRSHNGGVRFLATGHENVRKDWVDRRTQHLILKGHSAGDAKEMAEKKVAEEPMADLIGEEMDQLSGRLVRTDFGLESGWFGPRQVGGRFHFMDDGTFRIAEVTSEAGGLVRSELAAVKRIFENETLRLQHMGQIELPANIRAREVAGFKMLLANAGVADDQVAQVMGRFAPKVATDEALEKFLVGFYREVGKNEGQVLDAVTRAFGADPTRAAIELAMPIDAFRALAVQPDLRGTLSLQQIMSRSMRIAARGVIDTPPVSRGDLVVMAQQLVAQNPGSRMVSRGINSVTVELNVRGVASKVRLQTDGINPWILVATVPTTTSQAAHR
jgi:hypothetical protein